MDNLIFEFEELLKQITNKELSKNNKALKKANEIKELLKALKNQNLSNANPMIRFINAKALLEN